MQSVMTVRLSKEDFELVDKISSEEKIDKSKTVRELIELGKIYFAILKYREGKISIRKAAKTANISISEMMDLFASLGIENNLDVMDYKKGLENIKNL